MVIKKDDSCRERLRKTKTGQLHRPAGILKISWFLLLMPSLLWMIVKIRLNLFWRSILIFMCFQEISLLESSFWDIIQFNTKNVAQYFADFVQFLTFHYFILGKTIFKSSKFWRHRNLEPTIHGQTKRTVGCFCFLFSWCREKKCLVLCIEVWIFQENFVKMPKHKCSSRIDLNPMCWLLSADPG